MKELFYGLAVVVMGIIGAIPSAFLTLAIRNEIIERTQPNFRWDWDFAGYFYLLGGGFTGFLLASGLTAWLIIKFDIR